MSKPRVTLATSASMPDLYPGELGILDALSDRGLDPKIAVWNDPSVDWDAAGMVVVRSVTDYAINRAQFLKWANSIPRILNSPDVLNWNSNKNYLRELAKRGLPTIPTTWVDADQGLDKNRVHARFPALGDFVIKPSVSSGTRDIGRYSAISIPQRQAAIAQAMELLGAGRDVMIQRYQEVVEVHGERSLIFFNGLLSHAVDKNALLTTQGVHKPRILERDIRPHAITEQEIRWGEQIRAAVHDYVRERMGRDEQFLFNRVDILPTDEGEGFLVMEVALVDADLYLAVDPAALDTFADAIAMRAFW